MATEVTSASAPTVNPFERNRGVVAQLPLSVRSSIAWETEDRSTSEHGFDHRPLSCRIEGDVDPSDLKTALLILDQACRPADPKLCGQWLAEVRLLCRPRDMAEADIVVQLRLYVRELAAWPADVVEHVLSRWHHEHSFWPDWHELQLELAAVAGPRIMRRDAVRRALEALS